MSIFDLFARRGYECYLCGKEGNLSWVEHFDYYYMEVSKKVPYHDECVPAALASKVEEIRDRAVYVVQMMEGQEKRAKERSDKKIAAWHDACNYLRRREENRGVFESVRDEAYFNRKEEDVPPSSVGTKG